MVGERPAAGMRNPWIEWLLCGQQQQQQQQNADGVMRMLPKQHAAAGLRQPGLPRFIY